MLLHIIARGKIARSPEAELVDRYAKRITWPFRHTELPDIGGKVPAPCRRLPRSAARRARQALTSEEFAALLGRWRDEGVREAAS